MSHAIWTFLMYKDEQTSLNVPTYYLTHWKGEHIITKPNNLENIIELLRIYNIFSCTNFLFPSYHMSSSTGSEQTTKLNCVSFLREKNWRRNLFCMCRVDYMNGDSILAWLMQLLQTYNCLKNYWTWCKLYPSSKWN